MKKMTALIFGILLGLSFVAAQAAEPRIMPKPKPTKERPFAEHFVVFQLSSGSEFEQRLVLNNVANLMKYYGGPDKVAFEVVTYGPGLRLLFKENEKATRIKSLAANGVTFSACGNTMKKMGRTKSKLIKEAKQVPAGVARIVELQEAGWTYIRP